MSEVKESNSLGIGTLLFLIFLVLKLTNTITWSWWWVFSPLWIPLVIALLIYLIFLRQ
jgi:uncharacterized membrane protein